jgi:hypothetical protein
VPIKEAKPDDESLYDDEDEDEEEFSEDSETPPHEQKTLTSGNNHRHFLASLAETEAHEDELDEFLSTENATANNNGYKGDNMDETQNEQKQQQEYNHNEEQQEPHVRTSGGKSKHKEDVVFFLEPVSAAKKEKREDNAWPSEASSMNHIEGGSFLKQEPLAAQQNQPGPFMMDMMQIKTDFTCSVNNEDSHRYIQQLNSILGEWENEQKIS